MSDPLAYTAFALAAGNGTIDGHPARALVAAGLAILSHGAPVVRALHGRRSALLLAPGAAWVSAMAASEGRSAVLLDPALPQQQLGTVLAEHDVGVVFTTQALAPSLPEGTPHLVLDAVPREAAWHATDGAVRTLDLTTHHGLQLEGELDVEGSADEVWRLVSAGGETAVMTHRELLGGARAFVAESRLAARDHALVLGAGVATELLVYGVVAPLLAGARVTCQVPDPSEPGRSDTAALTALERDGVSLMVADVAGYEGVLSALAARGAALDAPVLQRCIAAGGASPALAEVAVRWREATGVPLLQRRPHGSA